MANGNPKPRVWWEKKDNKTSMFKRVKNERSDELHFDTLDERNLGDYRCFAQNEEKTSSWDFKLSNSYLGGTLVYVVIAAEASESEANERRSRSNLCRCKTF